MLDKEDITVLKEMLDEFGQTIKIEVRDEIRSTVSASEQRMKDHVVQVVDNVKREIVTELSELLDTTVLPQIAELQTEMTTVRHHLKLA